MSRQSATQASGQKHAATAITRGLLQRKCACGSHSLAGGECGECSKKRLNLRTKFKTSEPGDGYEQEAERVANHVMKAQASSPVSGAPSRIQRFAGRPTRHADAARAHVSQAFAGSRWPLEPTLRQDMEQHFAHDFSRVRAYAHVPQAIQAKLTIGKTGDAYEQEADRVATAIMHMPERRALKDYMHARAVIPAGQNCPWCKTEVRRQPTDIVFEVPEEEEMLQTKALSGEMPELPPGLDTELSARDGGGQRLPHSLRTFLEPRFGYDLSHVCIHNDSWAHQAARAVSARAFTLGRNIIFGAGQYSPSTLEGRHLLAHELTHTIQQGAVSRRLPTIQLSAAGVAGSQENLPTVKPSSAAAMPMLQKKDCNFYVYDSTEPTKLGTAWKLAAIGLAMKARGGYYVPSGNSIENMLHRVLSTYAEEDCDCIEEIQFLSHGSPGNAMSISKSGDELNINDFNIPELDKYGDGPRDAAYRAWHDKLTPRQRRLVLLRRILCGRDAEVYYRSCEAFQGKTGKEFAKASAAFWRAKVIGHTKVIGLTQPGKRVVKPGQEPSWSESEGAGGTPPKKSHISADVKPKKD